MHSLIALTLPMRLGSGTLILVSSLVIALVLLVILLRRLPELRRSASGDPQEDVIARHEVTLAELTRVRDELENRLRQRTAELEEAHARFAVATRDAVHGSRNLIQLVSALTLPGIEAHQYPAGFLRDLRGRINALSIATATLIESEDGMQVSLDRVIRRQVEPLFAEPSRQLGTEGPRLMIGTQGAQQLSLIAWELGARFAQMGRSIQSRGRIAVTWTITAQGDGEDQLMLEWRESFATRADLGEGKDGWGEDGWVDGTRTPEPLPDFSETLLTRIVPRLLGGKGRIEIAPWTFIYRLNCPVTALDHARQMQRAMGYQDEAGDESGERILSGP